MITKLVKIKKAAVVYLQQICAKTANLREKFKFG